MIPNHEQFLAAIKDHKKVNVRFYSKPDSGVVDRVCAPMDYGPGKGIQDGLNRYWLWDYASETGEHTLGLMPQQIVEMSVLGEMFDPTQFVAPPASPPVAVAAGLATASVATDEVIHPPAL